jgi:hypothetical protein
MSKAGTYLLAESAYRLRVALTENFFPNAGEKKLV